MDLSCLLPFTFRGLYYVRHLDIQESDLGTIESDAFTGISHIDNINILNNKIDFIKEFKLTNDSIVESLKFHGNHVLRAPNARDTDLQVHNISAIDNYFPCDCHIHELFDSDFVNGSIVEFRRKNYCISPLEFNGRPMSHIDFDSIARCHDNFVKDNLGSSAHMHFTIRSLLYVVTMIFYAVR
uniref:LRRCT domain-containing protein n=1 Tax=Bracon brevicornis TaxID=1563983 RepID=A0A6V7LD55_9HYME